MVMKGDIG